MKSKPISPLHFFLGSTLFLSHDPASQMAQRDEECEVGGQPKTALCCYFFLLHTLPLFHVFFGMSFSFLQSMFTCFSIASSMGCIEISALPQSSSQAEGNLCSSCWSNSSPFLLSAWCPQDCLSHFHPHSTVMQCFARSQKCFPRGATISAEGLCCVLWWVCQMAGTSWAYGEPAPVSPQRCHLCSPCLLVPEHLHLIVLECYRCHWQIKHANVISFCIASAEIEGNSAFTPLYRHDP